METMLTETRLSEVLRKVAEDAEVILRRDGRRWVAIVISSTFEGVDEAYRQRAVWQIILEQLSPDEQRLVEFIFTNTPAEQKQAASA